jgi:tRNA pseudouridine55 synthase
MAERPENDLGWLGNFHGFLLVDKPAGITSQDVITRLQHALVKRSGGRLKKRDLPSMGHGGTLDPFATGLLIVAVGDGVKLTRYLLGSDKSYSAEIAFGTRTASGDLTNEITARTDVLPADRSVLAQAVASFLGKPYFQIPPMYSAKKIEGTPLYEFARKGIDVERAAVVRGIRDFVIESAAEGAPPARGIALARVRATVSAGTFIRTLAEDLALRVGSLAHLTSLRRLASGRISLANAAPLGRLVETLEESGAWSDLPCFTPFHHAVLGILPRLEITVPVAERIFSGEVKTLAGLPLDRAGSIALYSRERLVAIVRDADPALGKPRMIERGFPLRFNDPVPNEESRGD